MGRFCCRGVSLFNFLLDSSDFLLFGEDGVFVHFLVAVEGGRNDSGYRTALLLAEFLSGSDVVGSKAFLDFGNEFSDGAVALGALQCDGTFNRENDNGEEEGLEDRHDDTAFEHGADQIEGMSFSELLRCEPHGCAGVAFSVEVRGVTENEEEENHCDDEACNDYQECVFDTTHVAAGLYSVALGSVRLLSFHNLIVLLNLNLLKIDSFLYMGHPPAR